jgi:hypothetical protein
VIHVWVRSTLDWLDEDAFWAQVPSRFKRRVELWNDVLDMPFHVFRHQVKEIAAWNLSHMRDAVVTSDWEEIPDGARVLPVDDDDWFSPDLPEILDREWSDALGVHWNPFWLGVPSDAGHYVYATRRRLFPSTPLHWTCDTNNYGLVKTPQAKQLALDHADATDWFDGAGRDRVRRIAGRLSINNRTLGSQTSMRPASRRGELDRARLLRRLARYKRLYRRTLPGRPPWARPYVARMAELMDQVDPADGS